MDVKTQIMELRPTIKENSAKNYTISLEKVNEHFHKTRAINNLEFLNKKDEIDNFLVGKSDLTKRNYYNAIIVVYDLVKDKDDEILKQYTEQRDAFNANYEEWSKTNQKSKKQETNWIEYDELEKIKDSYKKTNPMYYALLSLYYEIPIRNDVQNMKVVTKRGVNKIKKDDVEFKKYNYFVKDRNNALIILNQYKTAGRYGTKTIKLSKPLTKILMKWVKISDNKYLFETSPGVSLTSNQITRTFNKIFSKTDKKVSSTMLRHIICSHKFADDLKKRKELAHNMCHSTSMGQDYIKY